MSAEGPSLIRSCTLSATAPRTETSPVVQDRPYRLAPNEGDRAHAEPWDDAACARYVARAGRFRAQGFSAADADDLAERLHLRDADGDDRASCLECRNLDAGSRCHCDALGRLRVGRDDFTMLRRCPGFVAASRPVDNRSRAC